MAKGLNIKYIIGVTLFLVALAASSYGQQCSVSGNCIDENDESQGCRPGWFSAGCSEECPDHCNSTTGCNKVTGECEACETGWYHLPNCTEQCPQQCVACTAADDCTRCAAGFQKFKTLCCAEFCDSCLVNGTCDICQTGYYGEKCADRCSVSCGSTGCNETGACRECSSTTMYGEFCNKPCSNNCIGGCHINGTCQGTCRDGYYGDTCTASCNENCIGGCERIKGDCSLCKDGYRGSRCHETCSPNCKSETINGTKVNKCEKDTGRCTDGCAVRFHGDTCENPCPSGCKRCDNDTSCKRCEDERIWGLVCQFDCSDKCKDGECMKENGKCKSCISGHHGDVCENRCSANCNGGTCHQNATCDVGCIDNFYADTCDQECSAVINNCYKCSRDGAKCLMCSSAKFGEQCENDCPTNCEECTDLSNCTMCRSGFTGTTCENKCIPGCLDCDSQARCIECDDRKFGYNCEYDCPEKCDTCRSSTPGSNKATCLTCLTGNFFYNGRCIECPDNCEECSYFSDCQKCKPGFYGQTCGSTCPVNCVTCLSGTQCDSCKTGWSGEKCHCNENCTQSGDNWCAANGHCNEGCIPGQGGNNCNLPCPDSNCERCDQYSLACQSCKPGLWQGTFAGSLSCSENCGHCLTVKEGTPVCDMTTGGCTDCQDGWFGSKCMQQCSQHCKPLHGSTVTCDKNDGGCTLCQNGYYGSSCDRNCSRNCRNSLGDYACTKLDGTCHRCAVGYYGKYCDRKCNLNCQSACDKDNGNCDTCVPGYYGDQCDKSCPSHCGPGEGSFDIICNKYSGECLYCKPGFYGKTCNLTCSDRCRPFGPVPGSCDKANGDCIECRYGYHGSGCELNCSQNCLAHGETSKGHCDRDMGRCLDGCRDGWHNDSCDASCSINCLGKKCNQNGGECSNGCVNKYSGVFCQLKDEEVEEAGLQPAVMAVIAVVVILIIVLLLVGVLVYRRRRGQNYSKAPTNGNEMALHTIGNGVDTAQPLYANVNGKSTANKLPLPERQRAVQDDEILEDDEMAPLIGGQGGDASDYYNLSTHIPVDSFVVYVQGRRAEDKEWYKTDFQKLPKGLLKNCSAALSPSNKGKCRYKNLYPYDDTRVILQKEGNETDFVNGSYVSGYKKPQAFIAAQGPTDNNLNDFWRMIWQQDCGKIVMLTNLFEELKMKCVRYWPEVDSTEVFGNIEVSISHEDIFPDYIVRHLQASKKGSGEQKSIKQYHFTAWPDRGVPDSPGCILHFREKVMEPDTVPDGPILVHCSAGIGRTGTFIVVDYLIHQARAESHLDVFRCVTDMRYQRTNFVQTDIQYEFIHNALVEVLSTKDTEIKGADFCRHYWEYLQTIDEDTGRTKLHDQFDDLSKVSPALDPDSFRSGSDPENMMKNRFQDILPVDSFRAYLSTPVKDRNEYINAVFLPSYSDKYAYLLTQMPLPDTVVDFWRLVYDQRCTTIIMMNEPGSDRDQTVGEYWPSDDTKYGPFTVELLSCENNESFSVMTMKLTYKSYRKEDHMTVKQYRFEGWPDEDALPYNTAPLTRFISILAQERLQNKQAPAIVHCMNGVDRSGIFCVLSCVLEELQATNKINIVHTILQLRTRRPQLISTIEQFDFCHRAIAEYLESSQIYSNFL